MLKKLAVIVLSLLILLQSLQVTALLAYFYLNQDYITNNFCENRDKPELLCSGKCFVSKELRKQNDQWETKSKQHQKTIELTSLTQSDWLPGHSLPNFLRWVAFAGKASKSARLWTFDDDIPAQIAGCDIFKPPA